MIKHSKYIKGVFAFAVLLMASCADDTVTDNPEVQKTVSITSEIMPFDGEVQSRVNVDGNSFIDGDLIRMKIICPFVSTTERGEWTDGTSYDSFYYLKREGAAWKRIVSSDGYDINGSYSASSSPDIATYYEAQQTPYVYVATTWSEERRFIANGNLYDHLTPVFHADQTKVQNYRASDVLWAQTFMQTGAWNIHLGFQHKMACLSITIDGSLALDETKDIVLTLQGMPDIDQAEIVVGDYYADASKTNSGYGYQQKSSCSYENNGRVLGVAVNVESHSRAEIAPMSGNPVPGGDHSRTTTAVPNTGTYTAYKINARHFRLIVPPCVLTKNAVFMLRNGSSRYSVTLANKEFVEGKLYPVTLTLNNQ